MYQQPTCVQTVTSTDRDKKSVYRTSYMTIVNTTVMHQNLYLTSAAEPTANSY